VKRLLFGSLLLTSFLFGTVPAQVATTPNGTAAIQRRDKFAVPFVNKTLANGLEVIVLQDPSLPIVTVELAVRNGSFTEPPELNGLSHLYEHMFFKTNMATVLNLCDQRPDKGLGVPICGDAGRLRPQIGDVSYLRNIDRLGISYNGSTREEVVNYFFTTTSPYLETAIRVINNSVRFPLFNGQELEQEKRVVIGELDRNEANPFYYLFKAVNEKLFYKHPTRKNPGGTRDTVSKATTEHMRLIQSRYYHPNNAALVVTGDAKPEEVFDFYRRKGFRLQRMTTCGGSLGCNQYVFQRTDGS